MKKHRNAVIGLAAFAVFAVTVTSLVFTTLQRDVVGPTNTYSAIFTDVSGLAPGSDVRVAGVRVGRVDKVDLIGTLAKVTFRVSRGQTLYTNTVASVTYQNIIGQRYLGLAPGQGGGSTPLPNRAQIPKERTNPSFDISYLLNGFEPFFTELDPQQADNLTDAIIQAFQGDSSSILTLTTQTSALAQTLAGPDEVLGELIANMNQLMTTLAGQNANLQSLIGQSRGVIADLANRREQLVTSVGSINAVVGRLATIVTNISPDMQEFIGRQPGFLDYSLHDGRQRLAYLAANLPYLLKGLARVTQEGSYGGAYVCEFDISVFRFSYYLLRNLVLAATRSDDYPAWSTRPKHTPICQ
ncbi:MlaD family protein [Mycobacterium sp. pUA109]|uniref:MlaD family protein n=1 Tax=Mycobacterium sp. pUA109 TaxID=3238982 RepID=UPI00351B6052